MGVSDPKDASEIRGIVARQRQFHRGGRPRDVAFRKAQLKKLKSEMQAMEPELFQALHKDLGKSEFEAYTSEVGFVYEEIGYALANVDEWARPVRVPTPLLHQPSDSSIHPQPRGTVLIIGPWNYPLMLLLAPLVGAIAAGNTAVLKPSELAPATAAVVARLVARAFSPEYCAVVGGGVPETTALLAERFDHIFFTGSIPVGKIVMRAAAEHLTPVTLELGGKSPCIVDEHVDVAVAARRITWGKFYNAGQTCVAPDYLLVHRAVKPALLAGIKSALAEFFGADPSRSPDYGRIVNARHFDRLAELVDGRVFVGGERDKASLYFAPTVLDDARMSDKAMAGEIFGPVLPVLTFDALDEAIAMVRERPNPLALYVFTSRAATERRVVDEIPFGGGCVNNALIHLANPHMPFGGVGESGMGAYHGKFSFDTFSHKKAVTRTTTKLDIKLRYPPYAGRLGLIRKLMR
jgi:aldehyde dehydrogenase (NAD+)